jgi:hypothetical protein
MKLTKKQLKRMIQEELEGVQEVGGYAHDPAAEEQALVAALQRANSNLGEEHVTKIFNDLMASKDVPTPPLEEKKKQ